MGEMFAKEVLEMEGRTILNILAHDMTGYDKGFTIEFDDGTYMSLVPTVIQGPDSRIIPDFNGSNKDDKKRDKCKCGKIIVWDTDKNTKDPVVCIHCGTKYRIDCDDQLVHWLEEIFEQRNPWTTSAK